MTDRTRSRVIRHPWHRLFTATLAVATTLALMVGSSTVAQAKPDDHASPAARKAPQPSALSGTVTGTLQDGSGKVSGLFNVEKFAKRQGKLVAIGTFTGTVTDAAGTVHAGSKKIAMPLATEPAGGAARQAPTGDVAAQAVTSCQILNLVLGPLDLNLLGLAVHLDTVHLNITAEGGPGNLLGNLLCAVAGLLDGSSGLTGILNQLVGILNQLLAVLG